MKVFSTHNDTEYIYIYIFQAHRNTFPVWILPDDESEKMFYKNQTFGRRGLSEVMNSECFCVFGACLCILNAPPDDQLAGQGSCVSGDPQLFLFNPPSGTLRPFVITRLSDVTRVLRLNTPEMFAFLLFHLVKLWGRRDVINDFIKTGLHSFLPKNKLIVYWRLIDL